jgi:PAS domain S-box-containing protein
MKKPTARTASYTRYLQRWAASMNSPEAPRYPDFVRENLCESWYGLLPLITYIWDVQKMKYLHFSKNVLAFTGYPADEFLTKGPRFTFSLVHPEDIFEYVERVQKAQIEFLRALPAGEHSQYRFDSSFRFRRADGTYIHVLVQETIMQVDQAGNPLLSVGTVSDVSHLKKDNTITLAISRFHDKTGFSTVAHSFNCGEDPLSAREKEVLRLIAAGCTTQEIADRLCISTHTVKNHRRHMVEKMNVKNLAELIRSVVSNGLI